jgi:hypothetical protein
MAWLGLAWCPPVLSCPAEQWAPMDEANSCLTTVSPPPPSPVHLLQQKHSCATQSDMCAVLCQRVASCIGDLRVGDRQSFYEARLSSGSVSGPYASSSAGRTDWPPASSRARHTIRLRR